MQIIEVSVIGVRSAAITVTRRESPMRFVVFPMVHLGAPAFYREITARLGRCAIVVAEGIRGNSATTSILTLSYRLLRRSRRIGLVVQDLDLDGLGAQVVRPDMTGAQFGERWRQSVPVRHRLLMWCAVPFFAAGMLLFGSRRMLGRYLAVDDLPTRGQELQREALADLDRVLLDERDALLLDSLIALHEQHSPQDISIGVVYAAGHIPDVVTQLMARPGSQARSAEWLTVFGF